MKGFLGTPEADREKVVNILFVYLTWTFFGCFVVAVDILVRN